MHRWAYCRLTELVDKKIGIILDGLRKSPYADNTLVIFSSDHGDHDASHRLEHKTLFYEEAMNVPLIVCPPGSLVQKANKPTKVNNQNLVCIGTDLLPTVCDYAGAKAPEDLPGRSFRPLLAGKKVKDWPEAILIENQVGDAVVTADWKYASMLDQKDIPKLNPKKYSNPKVTKILCHLSEDPGEMKNLAYLPKYKKKVKQMQALLDELQKTQCKK